MLEMKCSVTGVLEAHATTLGVGFVRSAQVRDDVRVQHVHQESSTGLDNRPLIFGGSNSKSEVSG
jgi:hypothetical protein